MNHHSTYGTRYRYEYRRNEAQARSKYGRTRSEKEKQTSARSMQMQNENSEVPVLKSVRLFVVCSWCQSKLSACLVSCLFFFEQIKVVTRNHHV
jgi:hypothetical protein